MFRPGDLVYLIGQPRPETDKDTYVVREVRVDSKRVRVSANHESRIYDPWYEQRTFVLYQRRFIRNLPDWF